MMVQSIPPSGENNPKSPLKEIPEKVCNAANQLGQATLGTAKQIYSSTLSFAHSTARRGLELIAEDPAIPAALSREVVKAAPVIGATQRYASAWAKYHAALESQDEGSLKEARTACLVSLMEIGIDVASFGTGRLFRSASIATRLFKYLHSYRIARSFAPIGVDLFEAAASRFANEPWAIRLTNIMLSTIKPLTKEDKS